LPLTKNSQDIAKLCGKGSILGEIAAAAGVAFFIVPVRVNVGEVHGPLAMSVLLNAS